LKCGPYFVADDRAISSIESQPLPKLSPKLFHVKPADWWPARTVDCYVDKSLLSWKLSMAAFLMRDYCLRPALVCDRGGGGRAGFHQVRSRTELRGRIRDWANPVLGWLQIPVADCPVYPKFLPCYVSVG